MSSTEQTTVSPSNLQLINDALHDYARRMGIDFAQNPFADELRRSKTPTEILNLLQEREKAFVKYRNRNRTLINCLSPVVRVLHRFSGTLGAAVSLVSFTISLFRSHVIVQLNLTSTSILQRLSLSESMFSSLYVYLTLSSIRSLVTNGYVRSPVKSVQIMMTSSISSSAWAIS